MNLYQNIRITSLFLVENLGSNLIFLVINLLMLVSYVVYDYQPESIQSSANRQITLICGNIYPIMLFISYL